MTDFLHTLSKYATITHRYNIRQSTHSNLQLPSVRLNCARRFTIYNGPHLWLSEVPNYVKSAKTMKQFTNKYNRYLLDKLL